MRHKNNSRIRITKYKTEVKTKKRKKLKWRRLGNIQLKLNKKTKKLKW